MTLERGDLLTGLFASVILHAFVVAMVGLTWTSRPVLETVPELPSFVSAVVLEKPAAVKPVARPQPKPAKKPVAKPAPKPVSKPAPSKPADAPPARPEPAFDQPALSELLAREELAFTKADQTPVTAPADTASSVSDAEQAEVASYQQAIQQSVTSRWIIPATARGRDDLRASVRVTLLPGGEVLDIKLIKGSGDRAFDDSLQSAVRAASPLPVPSGPLFHERFRVMTLEFDPGMKK